MLPSQYFCTITRCVPSKYKTKVVLRPSVVLLTTRARGTRPGRPCPAARGCSWCHRRCAVEAPHRASIRILEHGSTVQWYCSSKFVIEARHGLLRQAVSTATTSRSVTTANTTTCISTSPFANRRRSKRQHLALFTTWKRRPGVVLCRAPVAPSHKTPVST